MKVLCINDKDFPHLTNGKVYEKIEVEDPPSYEGICISLDNGKLFFFQTMDRFKVLKKTSIAIIIDKSGSMSYLKDDVMGGYNQLIKDQQELEGECDVSLYFFSDKYEKVYESVPVKNVAPLDCYSPGGMTALYDAVGQTIDSLGDRLRAMEEKPDKVLVMIMTDGQENSSTDYSHEKVAEMIKHQKEKYSWDFMFLGANIDVDKVGNSLNITDNTAFSATSKGIEKTYGDLSRSVTRYRSS